MPAIPVAWCASQSLSNHQCPSLGFCRLLQGNEKSSSFILTVSEPDSPLHRLGSRVRKRWFGGERKPSKNVTASNPCLLPRRLGAGACAREQPAPGAGLMVSEPACLHGRAERNHGACVLQVWPGAVSLSAQGFMVCAAYTLGQSHGLRRLLKPLV